MSYEAVVAGSHNAEVGIPAAWAILESGGSALDAVETATRAVEDNELDHSVGYGGYPNLLGEVQLDAAIMDGEARRVGAVGALEGYRHPISVAREVMNRLPHNLLVGKGAARFADEVGFQIEDLLTDEARRIWSDGIDGRLPGKLELFRGPLAQLTALAADPEHVKGTVNVVARDKGGNLASAVSTSGWAWKYPDRLGDSPVIGGGIYADNRYGAAGCTGLGEISLRGGLARDFISRLAVGFPLEEAGRGAIEDLLPIAQEYPESAVMNMLAITKNGEIASFTTSPELKWVYMREGNKGPIREQCIRIEWPGIELNR